jgi:glutamate 5-kinase
LAVLLTDVDQLYSADPHSVPDAQPIPLVSHGLQLAQLQVKTGGGGSQWGTGGMVTKIAAARIATAAGVRTVITEGRFPHNIEKNLQGNLWALSLKPNFSPIELVNAGLHTV